MAKLEEALGDWLAGLGVGDERELGRSSYLEGIGTIPETVTSRDVVLRESDTVVVRSALVAKPGAPEERYETARYTGRELYDAALDDSRFRKLLGLPEPLEIDVIDRAIERLREGQSFRQGGGDDGGGHSGRGFSGQTQELRFDGSQFLLELVDFEGPNSSDAVETKRDTRPMDETRLRAEITTSTDRTVHSSLRYLLGLRVG